MAKAHWTYIPYTMMMKLVLALVLAVALVAYASALPSIDTSAPEMTLMAKAHKAAKEKVSSMLESGSDSSACAELASTTISEVEDNVKAQQEILDHFASPNNGEHCLTLGSEEVAAAEAALETAKTEAEDAASAAASAEGGSVDFGTVSLASLTEEDGAICGPFESDPEYVAAKAAAADAAAKAATAAGAIGGFETSVASAKEAAAKQVEHCECVTYTDYTAAFATASAHSEANAEAYAKGKHMECVLAGTAPADCDVGTTPAVSPITLADGVSEASCAGVDLDGPDWVQVVSAHSATADDSEITVGCDASHIMVGCDCHSWWDDCDGAHMKGGGQCMARAGGGNYVTAQGICAYYKDKAQTDVTEVVGPQIGGDDKISSAACPEGSQLASCTCNSFWKACDGATISGDTCQAHAGTGDDRQWVEAHGTCVTGDYTYLTIQGARSGKGDDNTSDATCPEGYKLTGCSCHSYWRSCDGAMPAGQTCHAYESGGGHGVDAYARCVKSGTYGPEK